ncbi:unnamed protein product [Pedinophyceae sp. YPF-701]|nr:unnamed protein product [Pedinophyceae sp. YPF-701]
MAGTYTLGSPSDSEYYDDDPWEQFKQYFEFSSDPAVRLKFQKTVRKSKLSANLCARGSLSMGGLKVPSSQAYATRKVELTAKPVHGSWKLWPGVIEIHKIHLEPFQGRAFVQTPSISLGPVSVQLSVGLNMEAPRGTSPLLWGYRMQMFQDVNLKEGTPSHKLRLGMNPGGISLRSQHYNNSALKGRMGWDIKCNYPAFAAGNFGNDLGPMEHTTASADADLGKIAINWRSADLIVDMDAVNSAFSRRRERKGSAETTTIVMDLGDSNREPASLGGNASSVRPAGWQAASMADMLEIDKAASR